VPGISACRLWKVLRLCALLTSKTRDSAKSSSSSAEPASSKGEAPLHGLVAHDLGVMRDVRGRGGEVRDLRQEHGAADLIELLPRVELLGERDQIDRPALFVDRQHRAIDGLVRRVVEVVGAQLERDVVEGARVEQQRREHRALGVEVVRRDTAGEAARLALAAPRPAARGTAAAVVSRCPCHPPPPWRRRARR
jgi:hypothetical protein